MGATVVDDALLILLLLLVWLVLVEDVAPIELISGLEADEDDATGGDRGLRDAGRLIADRPLDGTDGVVADVVVVFVVDVDALLVYSSSTTDDAADEGEHP